MACLPRRVLLLLLLRRAALPAVIRAAMLLPLLLLLLLVGSETGVDFTATPGLLLTACTAPSPAAARPAHQSSLAWACLAASFWFLCPRPPARVSRWRGLAAVLHEGMTPGQVFQLVPGTLTAALWRARWIDPSCRPNRFALLPCAVIDAYRVVATPTSGPIITVIGMGVASQGTQVGPQACWEEGWKGRGWRGAAAALLGGRTCYCCCCSRQVL